METLGFAKSPSISGIPGPVSLIYFLPFRPPTLSECRCKMQRESQLRPLAMHLRQSIVERNTCLLDVCNDHSNWTHPVVTVTSADPDDDNQPTVLTIPRVRAFLSSRTCHLPCSSNHYDQLVQIFLLYLVITSGMLSTVFPSH